MQPLILYPSKDRLNKALGAGLALMVAPVLVGLLGLGALVPYLPHVCMFAFFGGAVLIGKTIAMQRQDKAVFAADAYGFSVRGGRKLEWSAFKGADTLAFDTAVVLQADGVGPRGRVEIKTLELSGPARDMVKQIEDYAALAKRNALMGGAVGFGGAKPGQAGPATLEDATQVAARAPVAPVAPQAAPMRQPVAALDHRPLGDIRSSEVGGALPPIALYPRRNGAIKALVAAAGFLLVGAKVLGSADAADAIYAGWVFVGLGGCSVAFTVQSLLSKAPSFAADLDGFSVKGKPKRGWDEFRGVRVRTVRYGWIPVARDVVVKTGKSVLGGSVTINALYQSAPAVDMAAEIDQYAKAVARYARVAAPAAQVAPQSARPTPIGLERPHQPAPAAARRGSFEDRLRDAGPIRSQPSLSERIFGRRKVI